MPHAPSAVSIREFDICILQSCTIESPYEIEVISLGDGMAVGGHRESVAGESADQMRRVDRGTATRCRTIRNL